METLRLALEAIAKDDALWLARHTPAEWRDTYGQWTQAERIVRGTGARGLAETQQRLLQTGRDVFVLLQAVDHPLTPAATAALPAVALLRQVWSQQYRWVPGDSAVVELQDIALCDHASRSAEERHELIDNPHDPQARFATKRSQSWTGYKLHLTETAAEDAPSLITDVAIVAANSYDAVAVDTIQEDTIQERLKQRHLLPQTHLADAGYVDGATLVESARHGVELLGPVAADNSSALHKAPGFGVEHFELDFSHQQARCPQGDEAIRWHQQPRSDNPRQQMVVISWDKGVCRHCAHRKECLGPGQRPRTIKVSAQYPQLVARRQEQKGEAFQERYRRRAGIEATFSHLVNVHRARRTPYRGGGKSELRYLALASAINLQRVVAWQAGTRPQRQRRSCLRSLLAGQREPVEENVG